MRLFRIAIGVAKSGDTAAAEGISDPYARASILATLAERRVHGGDRAGGLQVARAALSSVESIGDEKLRARVLRQISEAQVSAGDVDGVRQTIGRVLRLAGASDDAGLHEAMTSAVAKAQANAGDFVGALATATEISDSDSKAHALLEIATALSR